jgi:proteasome accessory factor B
VFRMSRVLGQAKMSGPAGSFDVPPGTDVREVARRLEPAVPAQEAVLLVRVGRAAALRRAGETVESGVPGPDGTTEWDRVRLPGGAQADEVLALGPDVYVEGPVVLRDEVVDRLRTAVAAVEARR